MQNHKRFLIVVLACSFIFAFQPVTIGVTQESTPAIEAELKALEKKIEEGEKETSRLNRTAEYLRLELRKLQGKRVENAAAIRRSEAHILDLEDKIRRLNKQKANKLSTLDDKWKQVSHINSALIKLSLLPPLTMIAYPNDPSDMIKTGILFGGTVPEIEKRAYKLRDELISLDQTQSQIAQRKLELAKATKILENRRKMMDRILSIKMGVRQKTLAARQVETSRLQRLAREANNLRELFNHLRKERLIRELPSGSTYGIRGKNKKLQKIPRRLDPNGTLSQMPPIETRPIKTARGELTFPVIGKINYQYGSVQRAGVTRKGILIESSAGAQVVSPYNGRIVFAGPFRGYGRLLIIEHGRGYHSLLAGMAHIHGSIGQWLLSGEPVAVMGKPLSGRPTLYMEFRVNGRPVNPNPWLATAKGKING